MANPGWRGLVTILIFLSVFLDELPCLEIVFIFVFVQTELRSHGWWGQEDSDSERESFQKIPGEKFKRPQALIHDVGIWKILSKIAYLHV